MLVKNASQIRVLRTIESIAKISLSAYEIERLVCGLHYTSSSKLNKTLREFITGICLSNTSFFQILLLLNQRCKSCEDAEYQLYRSTEGQICALDCGGTWSDSWSKKAFYQILYTFSKHAHKHSWYQSYRDCSSCSDRGGGREEYWKASNRRENAIAVRRDVSSEPQTFTTKRRRRYGVSSHRRLACFRKGNNNVPLRSLDRTRTVKKR